MSTSLWPIVQAGLKPVFVDVDQKTLNISIDDLKKKINNKTRALMLVHVLGNSANMDQIKLLEMKKYYSECAEKNLFENKEALKSFQNVIIEIADTVVIV